MSAPLNLLATPSEGQIPTPYIRQGIAEAPHPNKEVRTR